MTSVFVSIVWIKSFGVNVILNSLFSMVVSVLHLMNVQVGAVDKLETKNLLDSISAVAPAPMNFAVWVSNVSRSAGTTFKAQKRYQ